MEKYAAGKMELAPRDVVSRSIQPKINEGRGIDGKAMSIWTCAIWAGRPLWRSFPRFMSSF